MIEVLNISKNFQKTLCLDDINITFQAGDRVAILGANGAGKTTLVRTIMGYYHADCGTILVNGFNPIKDRVRVLESICFIPQLPPPIKISQEELIDYIVKSSSCKKDDIYEYALKMGFSIKEHKNKSFFKLSGGMKQKLLIAIAMAKNNPIMIFDEPTANLDPNGREIFYSLLKEIQEDKIILFITHRLDEIKQFVNRVVYMDLGKVVKDEKI